MKPIRGLRGVEAGAQENMHSIELLGELNSAFEEFKVRNDDRVDRIEARLNRPGLGGGTVDTLVRRRQELNAALREYARSGDDTKIKALSIGSEPDGGYLVEDLLAMTMTARAFEISPIRPFARVIQIGGTSWREPADISEPGSSWVGENEARPETTGPVPLADLNITPHEQYANPAVTQQLLEDSQFDIANWLGSKIATKFLREEAAAFVNGNGVNKPRGFLTHPIVSTADATRAWGELQYIPTGAASDFIAPTTSASPADCLIDTVYSMKATYRAGGRWYLNSGTAGKVRKFKDFDGKFVWTDSLIQGQPPLLMGYPVSFAEDMPAVGSNTYPIAFANMDVGYTIIDRVGTSVLRDPYTAKPKVLFYTRRRVGGGMSNSEAIKLVKVATA